MAGTNKRARRAEEKEIAVYLAEKEIKAALLALDMCRLREVAARDTTGMLSAVNHLVLKLESALRYIPQ